MDSHPLPRQSQPIEEAWVSTPSTVLRVPSLDKGSYSTRSSMRGRPSEVPGSILYVMRTLRASRHMESVECVTDHVVVIQSRVGGSTGGDFLVDGQYLVGVL